MKPLLTYPGGKRNELKYLLPYVPSDYNRYIEPFFGGGAMYFHLQPRRAIINDLNPNVINFYKTIQCDYNNFMEDLLGLFWQYEALSQNGKSELYYEVRDMLNNKIEKKYMDAVALLFLNKLCFSGSMRQNSKGEYNPSYAPSKNIIPNIITENYHKLLKTTEIYNSDYSEVFQMANEDDFMFLDPPYDCVFTDYGNKEYKDGFGKDEQIRLADAIKNLKCKYMLVINKTDFTESLYKDNIIAEYEKLYAIRFHGNGGFHARHIIVTNYTPTNLLFI